jgi:predicted enzyme related to lactoylglutathione lyase
MAHHSRIGALCIDCKAGDLGPAVAFWSTVLGREARIVEDGKYAEFDDADQSPRVILQAVDHEPRVHLDIETEDREAECARLKAAGASEVARIKDWIVMEAPTGHRFCLVKPQTADFPGDAPEWSD